MNHQMVIMARICRPYWWFGLGPAWPGRRQTPTGRPQPQITRRVKIDKQGHDRQSACKVPTLSGCCKAAPASAPGPEAERRRRPVGNRPTGYKITLSIQLNKWLEHDGLAVRCSAPGDADGCSIPLQILWPWFDSWYFHSRCGRRGFDSLACSEELAAIML